MYSCALVGKAVSTTKTTTSPVLPTGRHMNDVTAGAVASLLAGLCVVSARAKTNEGLDSVSTTALQ